jgi:hypothetical protein
MCPSFYYIRHLKIIKRDININLGMSDPLTHSENVRILTAEPPSCIQHPGYPISLPATFFSPTTMKSVITVTDTAIIFYGKDGKQSTIDIEKLVNFFN